MTKSLEGGFGSSEDEKEHGQEVDSELPDTPDTWERKRNEFGAMADERAARHNAQFMRVLDRKYLLPQEVVYELALLDNEAWEWERRAAPVIEQLWANLAAIERGEPLPHKVLLVILGGGVGGAYGAGQVLGLHDLGMDKAFYTVAGFSAGAPTAAFMLAGKEQTKAGARIFTNQCIDPNFGFIKPMRINQIVAVHKIIEVMQQHEEQALDIAAMKNHPASFYVAVTPADGGPTEFIDVKTASPDSFAALHASMALPIVYRKRIFVNGKLYVDGGVDPFPVELLLNQFKPDSMLVLPNFAMPPLETFGSAGIQKAVGSVMPERVMGVRLQNEKKGLLRHGVLANELRAVYGGSYQIPIGVMWPAVGEDMGLFVQDRKKVEASIALAKKRLHKVFHNHQPPAGKPIAMQVSA